MENHIERWNQCKIVSKNNRKIAATPDGLYFYALNDVIKISYYSKQIFYIRNKTSNKR